MDTFTNSWSAFEDLVIWALPIPVLYRLKVPNARKAGLYTLIGISFIPATRAGASTICGSTAGGQRKGGDLDSQGSTLGSAQPGDRRSRWSFLSWHGNAGAARKVPEEEPQDLNTEERPPTQRTMKAYVSSTDEAAPAGQHFGSHRRNYSSEDAESLCYVGEAMDRVSSISASSEEHNALSAK
ncbi:hypothetical protein XANCAGTX0491_009381 [Xanthoria calcicola]